MFSGLEREEDEEEEEEEVDVDGVAEDDEPMVEGSGTVLWASTDATET